MPRSSFQLGTHGSSFSVTTPLTFDFEMKLGTVSISINESLRGIGK